VKRDCCASVQSSLQELYPDLPTQVIPPCSSIPCGYEVVINKTLRTALIYHGCASLVMDILPSVEGLR